MTYTVPSGEVTTRPNPPFSPHTAFQLLLVTSVLTPSVLKTRSSRPPSGNSSEGLSRTEIDQLDGLQILSTWACGTTMRPKCIVQPTPVARRTPSSHSCRLV